MAKSKCRSRFDLTAAVAAVAENIFFWPYQGLSQGLSDPEADDIPMCHHASLWSNVPDSRGQGGFEWTFMSRTVRRVGVCL